MAGRIKVVRESETGRNATFKGTRTGGLMSRAQLVRRIEHGEYARYHVREIDGVKTPVSNPDSSERNNLG